MKNHLRILGWLYCVTCGLTLAIGLTLCVGLWLDTSASSQKAFIAIAPPFLIVACCGLLPGFVGGVGLLHFRPWARALLLIPSAFLLLMLPVGTVIGGYGFWALLNPETKVLFAGGEPAPVSPYTRPPSPVLGLLVVMATVAAGFFLVLKVGFILHHDPQPAPIDNDQLTITAVLVLFAGLVAATVWAVQTGARAATSARIQRDNDVFISVHTEVRRLRAAELAADPRKAKYASLVERGEDWSDENIDYYENPGRLATCVHLQLVEAAIRGAGIDARRYRKRDIDVKCRLEGGALQRDFDIAPPVRYAEFYVVDRDDEKLPTAFLICDEHKAMIHAVHPDAPHAESLPWFPSPPDKAGI